MSGRRNDFVNPVKEGEFIQLQQDLYNVGNWSSKLKYDCKSNSYVFEVDRDRTCVMHSTSDLLKYYFGGNLLNVLVDDEVKVIPSCQGNYEYIAYRGVPIAIGVSDSLAEEKFNNELVTIYKDYVNGIDISDLNQYVYGKNLTEKDLIDYIENDASLPLGVFGSGLSEYNKKLGNTFSAALTGYLYTYHTTHANSGFVINETEYVKALLALLNEDPFGIAYSTTAALNSISELVYLKTDEYTLLRSFSCGDISSEEQLYNYFYDIMGPDYKEWADKFTSYEIEWSADDYSISLGTTLSKDARINQSFVERRRNEKRWSEVINKFLRGLNIVYDNADSGAGLYEDNAPIEDEVYPRLKNVKSEFDRAKTSQRSTGYNVIDPLIIDLGKDGFDIEQLENGTHFDLDSNGFAERMNWTRKDGFLALDLNGNGVIDNGGELFGDRTLLADGSYASGGFAALSQYDLNNDGVIDANDEIFSRLKVWTDKNGDGISAEDEVMTLEEAGISSIDLNAAEVNAETGTEAILGRKGSVRYTDGTTGEAAELWAASQLFDTVDKLDIEVTSENDVKGLGNIHDLNKALALDETGKLAEYVNEFKNAENKEEMFAASEKILYFLCGAEDIDISLRGGRVDARKLAVIEAALGEKFVGAEGENPNGNAAAILSPLYDEISYAYCFKLAKELYIGEYSKLILYKLDDDGNKQFNTAAFDIVIKHMENSGIDCTDIVAKAAAYIDLLSGFGYVGANDFYNTYFKRSYEYAEAINRFIGVGYIADGTEAMKASYDSDLIRGNDADNVIDALYGDDMIYAGAGNDTVNAGAGNDVIYGEDGDDTIKAGAGNDFINGGKGNDYLKGEDGDDTYVFNIGDGDDIVEEYESNNYGAQNDRIVFGEGITADSITMNRVGYDLIIEYGDGDRITVKNEFVSNYYGIEYIEFADGTVIDVDGIKREASTYIGTDGDDVLNGYISTSKYDINEYFYGGDGNDTINANTGDDTIFGGNGDDTVNAGAGNDIINGGKGNDYLKGEAGDDIYVFNIGDGDDIVEEYESNNYGAQNDRIVFGEGITADSITMNRVGYDLIIEYGDGDRITVKNEFSNNYYGIEYIEFADGTVIDIEGIKREASTYIGTDGDDVLNGYISSSKYDINEYFYGGDGNDTINANTGDDTIFGGNGDDTIKAGEGNDIINGGKGNDYLKGEGGDDVYVFNIGDGDDIVEEYESNNYGAQNDRIVFGEGITADSITMNRVGYDLIIEYGDGDRITVKNEFSNNYYGIEYIEFADGTVIDVDGIKKEASTYIGTDGDDVLKGYNSTNKYDINEYFYGGNGDDTVNAGKGNDIINGGKGNDYLKGEDGDDTYVFNIGDGDDIVEDYEWNNYGAQNDRIIFGEGITAESITFVRSGYDLIINYGEGDRITVKNEYLNSYYGVEYITLNDGRELYYTQAEQLIQAMSSFEADSGMTWTEAVENGDERTTQILNEMWVKPA